MAKKKEENAAVETEETKAKFREKLKSLLELGKKKRNILEYQEISDFFSDMELDAEKFDKILDFLEQNNIDVLRITDDDDDSNIILSDEDDVDVEQIDLSVRKKSNWQNGWSLVMKMQKNVWQRLTFVW